MFQKSSSAAFSTSHGSLTKTERKVSLQCSLTILQWHCVHQLSMAAFGYSDEKYDLEQKVEELEQKNEALEVKLMKCVCNKLNEDNTEVCSLGYLFMMFAL